MIFTHYRLINEIDKSAFSSEISAVKGLRVCIVSILTTPLTSMLESCCKFKKKTLWKTLVLPLKSVHLARLMDNN